MLPLTCSTRFAVASRVLSSLNRPWKSALLILTLLALLPGATARTQAQDVSLMHGRAAVASGATFSFGEVRQGQVVSRNFAIRNISDDSIDLGTPVVSGGGFTARLSRTFLRPNKKTRLLVLIDSGAIGSRTATITIPVLDSSSPPFTFMVTGDVTGPRPRIRVSGPGGTVFSGDDVFYGSASIGVPEDREFTIRNSGQQNLNIGAITLTGDAFEVVSQPATPIRPGRNARFTIRMLAGASGSPQSVATFTTNDPDVPVFTMMLSGSVGAAGPSVQVIGLGAFLTNNQSVSFGNVTAGSERTERFTIRNRGTALLTLGTVESSDPGFVIAVQPSTSLAPGANTELFVTYVSSVGDAAGTISIPSNAVENNPFNINVSGTGEPAPDIQVIGQQIQNMQVIDLILPRRGAVYSPPVVSIANVFAVLPMKIKNVGTLTLTLNGISVTNGFGSAFLVQTPPVDTTLDPGQETTFELGHISAVTGQTEARIAIFSTDPNDNPFNFDILVFVDPEVIPPLRPAQDSASFAMDADGGEIAPGAAVQFGPADVGEQVERHYTVTNTSSVALVLGEPQIRGEGFVIGVQPDRIVAPGEETHFSVVMEGSRPGRVAGVLLLNSNVESRQNPFAFLLSGEIGVDGR